MFSERSPGLAAAATAASTINRTSDSRRLRPSGERWRRWGLLALGMAVALAALVIGQSGARAASASSGLGASLAATSTGQTPGMAAQTSTPVSGGGGASGQQGATQRQAVAPVNPCALAASCGGAGGGGTGGQQSSPQPQPSPVVNPCALATSCGGAGGGNPGSGGGSGTGPSLSANPTKVPLSSCPAVGSTNLTYDTGGLLVQGKIDVKHADGTQQAVLAQTPFGKESDTIPTQTVAQGDNLYTLTVQGGQSVSAHVQGQCLSIPPNSCVITTSCGNNGGGSNGGLAGCLANPACIQAQPQPQTFYPTKALTSEIHYAGWNSTFCGPPDPGGGQASPSENTGTVSGGYNSYIDVGYVHEGESGWPCNWLEDWIDRGGVGFDVDKINNFLRDHGVKSATLQFTPHSDSVEVGGNPTGFQLNLGCISQMVASGDTWLSLDAGPDRIVGQGDGYQIDETYGIDLLPDGGAPLSFAPGTDSASPSPVSVDVTGVVSLATIYGNPNAPLVPDWHFVFAGNDESENNSDGNDCSILLDSFSLTITPDH